MKNLRIFLAALLTVLTLVHSRPSEAVVGKIIKNQRVVKAGLIVTGAGATVGVGGTALVSATCVDMGCLAVLFPMVIGGAIAAVGLVTLDGEQQEQFSPLDSKSASAISVSESDRRAYNEEIDQANMIFADVSNELLKIEEPSVSDSARIWESVRTYVSPATFSTMQKIVSQK